MNRYLNLILLIEGSVTLLYVLSSYAEKTLRYGYKLDEQEIGPYELDLDEVISIAIRNINDNRQNDNKKLNETNEKLLSFIRDKFITQDDKQLVHHEMRGYDPCSNYHYNGTCHF